MLTCALEHGMGICAPMWWDGLHLISQVLICALWLIPALVVAAFAGTVKQKTVPTGSGYRTVAFWRPFLLWTAILGCLPIALLVYSVVAAWLGLIASATDAVGGPGVVVGLVIAGGLAVLIYKFVRGEHALSKDRRSLVGDAGQHRAITPAPAPEIEPTPAPTSANNLPYGSYSGDPDGFLP